ncbi:Pentatricopeptide repeat-containing protein [Glycine max]|nr:Pentatricopeptide repeat-containing protein [Glycine max]
MYENMKPSGIVPNAYAYNCVISEYCNARMVDKALNVFAEMREKGGLCRGKKFGEAVKIVHQVNKVGLSPNIVTYNILINGFCDVGKIDTAVRLFNQLKSNGLSPTLVTYNTLIAGYSKVENLAGALDLVKEMEERCIPPSKTKLYEKNLRDAFFNGEVWFGFGCLHSVLIHGLCMNGNMKEASKLLKSLGELHLEPNSVIYNTMIHGYCKEGSSYRALRLFNEMVHSRMVPNVASFCSTIGLLCRDEKWQEAELLLGQFLSLSLIYILNA